MWRIWRQSSLGQPQRTTSHLCVEVGCRRRKMNRMFERGADMAEEASGLVEASQVAWGNSAVICKDNGGVSSIARWLCKCPLEGMTIRCEVFPTTLLTPWFSVGICNLYADIGILINWKTEDWSKTKLSEIKFLPSVRMELRIENKLN